jgi:transposase InsO family protein
MVRIKPEPLTVPATTNQIWSMDFMLEQLEDGSNLRLFNVLDDFNREALSVEIDFSLPSERVIRSLEQILEWRGVCLSDDQRVGGLVPQRQTCLHYHASQGAARSAGCEVLLEVITWMP